MYNNKDDNDYMYSEGFLYEDVNWKLVEEYAREEKIGVKISLSKILQFFLVRQMISVLHVQYEICLPIDQMSYEVQKSFVDTALLS